MWHGRRVATDDLLNDGNLRFVLRNILQTRTDATIAIEPVADCAVHLKNCGASFCIARCCQYRTKVGVSIPGLIHGQQKQQCCKQGSKQCQGQTLDNCVGTWRCALVQKFSSQRYGQKKYCCLIKHFNTLSFLTPTQRSFKLFHSFTPAMGSLNCIRRLIGQTQEEHSQRSIHKGASTGEHQ